MEPYQGDILEHALNKGLASAAARYQVPVEQVRAIVEQFASEVEPTKAEQEAHDNRRDTSCDIYLVNEQPYGKRIYPDGRPW